MSEPASVFERFLSTPQMLEIFGAPSFVQAMLDVESALARAQAAEGLIAQASADAIGSQCRAGLVDVDAIVSASTRAGSLAIPLVKQLTEAVARVDADAAKQVHWGSTSQDIIDSANVLLTRRAIVLVEHELSALIDALLALAQAHGDAPVLARTLIQPASVVSFGFKCIAWVQPLLRTQRKLRAAAADALQLQLGGAVGTLSAMGDAGPAVARRMADRLGLPPPHGAWHTQRDDWIRLGCELGVLCGALGKLARDWSLMAQAEVGELAEPTGAGRGGSSAMPHKRNPVAAMVALAAAQRAPQRVAALLQCMPQEHERGLGNWQAELAEWAELFLIAHGAVRALAEAAPGLHVDTARMARNIEQLQGVVNAEAVTMRLAAVLGKPRAQALMEQLSRRAIDEGRHLRELVSQAIAQDPALAAISQQEIASLFDPQLAAAPARALAARRLPELQAAAVEVRKVS